MEHSVLGCNFYGANHFRMSNLARIRVVRCSEKRSIFRVPRVPHPVRMEPLFEFDAEKRGERVLVRVGRP